MLRLTTLLITSSTYKFLQSQDPQPDNYNTIPSWIQNLQIGEPSSENDNGGVHYLSGIPNKAFATCALAFDGFSWEKAGKIWWAAVTSGLISPNCTFIQFADITVEQASALYGAADARTVRDAWNAVGVEREF